MSCPSPTRGLASASTAPPSKSSYAEFVLSPTAAQELATELLASNSRRWLHSAAVADQAGRLGEGLDPDEADQLVAAAWLHDIGYADAICETGFHPLDGARFLNGRGERALACLTAHHSNSAIEAGYRGLLPQLAEFEVPPQQLLAALTFCDMTSGPTGARVTFDDRIAEILQRYGREHVVGQSIITGEPTLRAAVERFAHLV